MTGITANPGQNVTLAVQVLDGYGERVDGYAPQVDFIRDPSGNNISGYPENMVRISEGLYISTIVIPNGINAVGTYLVSTSWNKPNTNNLNYELFIIHVARPFGTATATPA